MLFVKFSVTLTVHWMCFDASLTLLEMCVLATQAMMQPNLFKQTVAHN